MINVILIIIAMMAYMFVGLLIGMFIDDCDIGFMAVMAAFWPTIFLLYIPYKLADIVYTKIRMWRLNHK